MPLSPHQTFWCSLPWNPLVQPSFCFSDNPIFLFNHHLIPFSARDTGLVCREIYITAPSCTTIPTNPDKPFPRKYRLSLLENTRGNKYRHT